MANKKFKTSISIEADRTYDCTISKDYSEIYTIKQSLPNEDAGVKLVSTSATKSIGTIASAQAILLKNTGNICAEIFLILSKIE